MRSRASRKTRKGKKKGNKVIQITSVFPQIQTMRDNGKRLGDKSVNGSEELSAEVGVETMVKVTHDHSCVHRRLHLQ